MLTKNDKEFLASTFATKKDLIGLATKKDLSGFATKKDLSGFATKKDLEATNTALAEIKESLEKLIFDVESLTQDHRFVVHHSMENFDTNEQQDKRLDRIEKHLDLPALAV